MHAGVTSNAHFWVGSEVGAKLGGAEGAAVGEVGAVVGEHVSPQHVRGQNWRTSGSNRPSQHPAFEQPTEPAANATSSGEQLGDAVGAVGVELAGAAEGAGVTGAAVGAGVGLQVNSQQVRWHQCCRMFRRTSGLSEQHSTRLRAMLQNAWLSPWENAHGVGIEVGAAVGSDTVGAGVGAGDGMGVGARDGDGDGRCVGTVDGNCVGGGEGEGVGDWDGAGEGAIVGPTVGRGVGAEVGPAVGAGIGDCVGATVGGRMAELM